MKRDIKVIKKRSDFLRIARVGIRFRAPGITVLCAKKSLTDDFSASVGYTASKKVGSAVLRNKAKRRLRHIVFDLKNDLEGGCEFVFIANYKTPCMDFSELKSGFLECITKCKEKLNLQNA